MATSFDQAAVKLGFAGFADLLVKKGYIEKGQNPAQVIGIPASYCILRGEYHKAGFSTAEFDGYIVGFSGGVAPDDFCSQLTKTDGQDAGGGSGLAGILFPLFLIGGAVAVRSARKKG